MWLRKFIFKVAVFLMCIGSLNLMSTDAAHSLAENLYPVHSVSVRAPYGYSNGLIRVRLSDSEWRIIQKLEPITHFSEQSDLLPNGSVTWQIEPSAVNSPTLRLGIRSLQDTRKIFTLLGVQEEPVTIVVARTQKFINDQLHKIDCHPNLQLTNGIHVMGEAICNHRVIVINLTGYFFYRYINQSITSTMEQRSEPPLLNLSYLLVDRNISGLSHEWIHVIRGVLAEGFVPEDEPAWFREGFAEIMSGISRASSFNNKLNYLGFHVIRIRKFSTWNSRCLLPLNRYRLTSSQVSGCEYLRGATAIELLLANHGGLSKIVNLYRDVVETNDFTTSFHRVYGFSLASFERSADRYAQDIKRVAALNN